MLIFLYYNSTIYRIPPQKTTFNCFVNVSGDLNLHLRIPKFQCCTKTCLNNCISLDLLNQCNPPMHCLGLKSWFLCNANLMLLWTLILSPGIRRVTYTCEVQEPFLRGKWVSGPNSNLS